MCTVVFFILDLQTLVGQVNEVVFVVQVVVGRCSPDIALFIEVNAEVIGNYCPHPNVEFPCSI